MASMARQQRLRHQRGEQAWQQRLRHQRGEQAVWVRRHRRHHAERRVHRGHRRPPAYAGALRRRHQQEAECPQWHNAHVCMKSPPSLTALNVSSP
jgi:hypothetical protein